MLYIRGSDPPLDGVIRKVHPEAGDPPYYTVLIAVTGNEKNTDHSHLRHRGKEVRPRVKSSVPRRRRGMLSTTLIIRPCQRTVRPCDATAAWFLGVLGNTVAWKMWVLVCALVRKSTYSMHACVQPS